MKMSPKRLYFVMIGILVFLGVLSISAVVLGDKMLSQRNQKLTELKLESEVLDRQKQDVVSAKINIEKYDDLEKIAKQIVPQDKDQAKTVREIVLFAQAAGIKIKSISFPSSTLGQKAAPTTKPAEGEEAPKASTPAAPPVSQVKPVAGLNGVYEQEVTMTSATDAATFQSFIDFLKDLEANRRTAQVSNMIVTPNTNNRNLLSFTITFKVYIKP